MSDAEKLSCQSSVMDWADGMQGIHEILKDIDKCNDHTIIRKLTALLNTLTTADVSKDFETFDGPKKILRLINNKNKKIVKLTFLILGQYVTRSEKGINSKMLNMQVFGTLSKTLEDIDSLSYNFAQSALFLLSSVVALDKIGQILARKSKCLHRLIVLFLRILPSLIRNENWEEERAIRESKGHYETWKALCLSIKKSICNPQNKANQQQVNTIIPKSIIFLGDWIHYAKENDPLEKFVSSLISLLVQVLFHNQMNQTSFAAYSGIPIIIGGLKKFEGFTHSSTGEVTNKMIRLLNAAVSGHKDNCLLTISLGGMDMLLQLLKILPGNEKFPVIVTLTHLVHKGDENNEKFVKAEGLSTLAVATVNVGTDPTERQAVSKLLKSWAEKISSFNNQQKKSVENDQPFRDNSLLKLKTSFVVDHQVFHEECATEVCHIGNQEKDRTLLKEVRLECIDSHSALSTKKSKVMAHEVLTKRDKEASVPKINKKHMLSPVNQNVDPTEPQLIVIARNKSEEIAPDDLVENRETIHLKKKDTRNEIKKVDPTLQNNDEHCNLLKPTGCLEVNKEEFPEQNTIECTDRKPNQHRLSPFSTHTSRLNDVSMLCLNDGLVPQSGRLANISSSDSNLEQLQEHSKKIPRLSEQDICQEDLNKSSESEYASALDTTFASDLSLSSCKAACNASTIKIHDVTINSCDDYLDSSSGGSMKTQCTTEDKLELVLNNSSDSSDSSTFDEHTVPSKRSRESYENFSTKVKSHSGSDFDSQDARHSTSRPKKPKLVKKCSISRCTKQQILSYQNISLPSSNAGFSAVTLNSSISSSNKSSRLQLSREEIDNLELGSARFGKNFKALMSSSFSTNK